MEYVINGLKLHLHPVFVEHTWTKEKIDWRTQNEIYRLNSLLYVISSANKRDAETITNRLASEFNDRHSDARISFQVKEKTEKEAKKWRRNTYEIKMVFRGNASKLTYAKDLIEEAESNENSKGKLG